MFEFFKDPFGTKRIAKLEAQLQDRKQNQQMLLGLNNNLQQTIKAKDAEIADLQTQIARTPVAMVAYHILARNIGKLPESDRIRAEALFAAERPYRKPRPAVQSSFASLPKPGEDQYL